MITISHAYDQFRLLTSSTADSILSFNGWLGLKRIPSELTSYILQDERSSHSSTLVQGVNVYSVKRGLSTQINTQSLFTRNQTVAIQATACTLAVISLIGSLVTCYWFSKMRKKFRHKLIIILIVADLIRSTWLFIFPLISLTHGEVQTQSNLCQAGGFFIQVGIELADFAILVIAIHTALQVFNPTVGHQKNHKETGLYRYRYAVYTLAIVVPPTLCSLVFIRGEFGYLSQGPTCSLPLRPFWYRLAISWIPRYLVLMVVAGLYCAIYVHVRVQYGRVGFFGCRTKREEVSKSANTDSTSTQSVTQTDGIDEEYRFDQPASIRHIRTISSLDPGSPTTIRVADESTRRASDGTTAAATPIRGSLDLGRVDTGVGFWTRQGQALAADVDGNQETRRKFSSIPSSTIASIPATIIEDSPVQFNSPVEEQPTNPQAPNIIGKQIVTKQMRATEHAITHQLRLLFAYPLCYFIIWLVPFISHSCNYDNYLVQHPIFVISLLSFASIAAMGAVDSLVFSIREKPWRHITGSDGTFVGSFLFWRHDPTRRHSYETDTTELNSRHFSAATARSVSTLLAIRPSLLHIESYHSNNSHTSQPQFKYSSSSQDRCMIDDAVDVRMDMDLSDPFRGGLKLTRPTIQHGDAEAGVAQENGIESNDFAARNSPSSAKYVHAAGGRDRMSMLPEDEIDRELYFIDRRLAGALRRQQLLQHHQS